ncbi:polyadenylate-binding protein 1A-like [Ictalurus furcatus]|uniref:polyadenylate-binding protein 1A-like n=1 Tax=Ictalurus furcatus TaxID=66913 RepID=UPI0023508979|nr:polyadenylate-binding protein 1A-like [Ictalurus furcatus]
MQDVPLLKVVWDENRSKRHSYVYFQTPEAMEKSIKKLNGMLLKATVCKPGPVVNTQVVTSENGKSKGIGYAHLVSQEYTPRAVGEMNEKELNTEQVYVDQAQKKEGRQTKLKHKFKQMYTYTVDVDFAFFSVVCEPVCGAPV